MKDKTRLWFKALVAAFITGLSNSFLSAVGIGVAGALGVEIKQLNLKQLCFTTLFGGAIGAFSYLKQSPVPPDSTGDTVPPFKIN